MKTKHFATIILTSLLIATVFGSVTVFAPAPPDPNPNSILDAFVTNTSDDPVPVDITDNFINVNLDEPIEVNVDVNTDVSGWLHTTESGRVYEENVTEAYHDMIRINTKGFRQLTINYYTYGDDCEFLLYMDVWISPLSYAGIDVKIETIPHGVPTTITYDVTSDFVDVLVTPKTGGPTIVAVTYYMTT